MTLPKKNSRSIEINSLRFRYIVSKSGTDDGESFMLNLTVQIEHGQGRLLKATGFLTRDFWLDFPEVESPDKYPVIRPRHVATIIRLARASGWEAEQSGSTFQLQVTPELLLA